MFTAHNSAALNAIFATSCLELVFHICIPLLDDSLTPFNLIADLSLYCVLVLVSLG